MRWGVSFAVIGAIPAGVGLGGMPGCRPVIPDNTFVCSDDAGCPTGQTCILERCRSAWQCNDLCGDANQDGVVDAADRGLLEALATTADACSAVTDAPTLCQCNAVDIDGNREIDELDLAAFDSDTLSCRWTDPLAAPEFCVPHLLDPPGRVVVDDSSFVDATHALTWTGDRFLTVYESSFDIIARSIEPDGTVGPANNFGPIDGAPPQLTGSNGHAAALMGVGSERRLMILDETGAEVTTLPLEGAAVPIPFRDAFALLEDGQLTPLALNGTLGTPQSLTDAAVPLMAVEDRSLGRLAYAHGPEGFCGDLAFGMVDATTFDPVAPTDVLRGGDETDPFGWWPTSLLLSDGRYVSFMVAKNYESCTDQSWMPEGFEYLVRLYDADGLPLGDPAPVDVESSLHEVVATDRYLVWNLSYDGAYALFDRTGQRYVTEGPVGESYFWHEEDVVTDSAGVAAYSSDGVGFVYARQTNGYFAYELVFVTLGCEG